jgi:PAS domain S-box-containing protein
MGSADESGKGLILANAGRGGSNRPARTAAATTNERGIENIHRLLFEQMSSAVAIGETLFDEAGKPIDYRIVEVNPAYERLTGQRADQVIGMQAFGVNPQLRPELIERLNRVAVSGQSEEFEGHHAETDRSVLIRLSRVGTTWVMAMIEDVTDRRRAESAMRDRNAFVETIIASSGEGLVVFDLDLRYVVWNPRMEEMTGLAADRVLGRRARDIFPAVMAAGIEENLLRVIETGQPQSREFEYTVPETGRGGWSLNTHRPHRDARGQIIGVIASVRDITARHEAEEALRQSEEQFRIIFDSMGDGVAISEPGGNFLEVNRVVCERLGYTRAQLLAMPVGAINSPTSAATIPKRVEAMLRGGHIRAIEATHVVRTPAWWPWISRSRPLIAPKTAATRSRVDMSTWNCRSVGTPGHLELGRRACAARHGLESAGRSVGRRRGRFSRETPLPHSAADPPVPRREADRYPPYG